MKQYRVTGMSCAACQARVEKAVSGVPGVESCAVSLLTNSMGVEGTASDADIIRAVEAAGYGASVKGAAAAPSQEEALADRETPELKKRLLTSLGFLAVLMYLSMGPMIGLKQPALFRESEVALGIAEMLLAVVILFVNRRFFVSGIKSVLHGAPNMDTLVALGSGASFVWSVCVLFGKTAPQPCAWADNYYFESAAMIPALITVGKMLEARSKGKTTNALKALMKLAPKTAMLIENGEERTVPAEEVRVGDIFAVRPGESIPADGVVLEGDTAVNESALTGESIPVDKAAGDPVSAATINVSGYVRCRAVRVGEDTGLMQIIKMVSDAAATKAPAAKIADRVSAVFVPAVTGIALITLAVWLLLGKTFSYALARAVSVLVISCPCALGLATPVAIMVGSGTGAKHGILFKTAVSLEMTGKAKIAVLDKTGTITEGEPEVTKIVTADGVTETEFLSAARALESESEHPLARAIVRAAEQRGIPGEPVTAFRALPGNGLTAIRNGRQLQGGSVRFLSAVAEQNAKLMRAAEELSGKGRTPVLFAEDGVMLGVAGITDRVKPESAEAVRQLEKQGIRVVMLTGDNGKTARAVAETVGIRHVAAGVLPGGKENAVRELKKLGSVMMVGDGINDAPALTSADTGAAIGTGTDVAVDAADVVLINNRLSDIPAAVRLSRAVLGNIRENLFWAFFYNAVCIPLAAGCWSALLGWQMNPMIGAAAMSLSSFTVVSNALRLNLVKVHSDKRDRAPKKTVSDDAVQAVLNKINAEREEKYMTKTMKIEGMMCPHCEARVKKTLEAIDGVVTAVASHTAGTAVVTLDKEIADDVLKAAIEAQDYQVTGIE